MTEKDKYYELVYTTQKALLGEVFSTLRGVAVDLHGETILLFFYVDGKISDESINDLQCVATEVIANYSTEKIDDKIIRIDFPTSLPIHRYWAYRRKETSSF